MDHYCNNYVIFYFILCIQISVIKYFCGYIVIIVYYDRLFYVYKIIKV